jgi:Zn-finger nucleic acid-binding protein
MSAPDAAHCSGCGRNLGLEPIPRDGTLPCPDCHLPMTDLDCGPGAVHDCARCGGQFVELAALRDLLERHDHLEAGLARAPASARPATAPVRYVACPVCSSLMNRRNFGGISGVVVDVCAKHGTWFDAGELPRVLAFAESGGLARARARAADERRRAVHERVAAISGTATSTHDFTHEAEHPGRSVLSDLLAAFFGD